jgi:hypothetical protein
MSTFTIQELTNAFIACRDALPEDHERRVRLAKVTELRYDTITPNLVHLVSENDNPMYRRVTKTSVWQAAREILYFPKHMISSSSSEFKQQVLNLSPELKAKYSILDMFEVDTMEGVVLIADYDLGFNVGSKLALHFLKKSNVDEYFLLKFMNTFAGTISGMSDPIKALGPLNAENMESLVPQIWFSGNFYTKMKARLEESSTLKELINQRLAPLISQIKVLTKEDSDLLINSAVALSNGQTISDEDGAKVDAMSTSIMYEMIISSLNASFPGLVDAATPNVNATAQIIYEQ